MGSEHSYSSVKTLKLSGNFVNKKQDREYNDNVSKWDDADVINTKYAFIEDVLKLYFSKARPFMLFWSK